MKIGENKLKMSDGSVRTFKSRRARNNFERVAQAVKHGWEPPDEHPGKRRRRRGK